MNNHYTNSDLIVLIPHFNDPEGLLESLASIQEEQPPDIMVVDDGSKRPPELDRLKAAISSKVYLKILPENQGIEYALNTGLREIQNLGNYKFVGRLDCGDFCLPGRFTAQMNCFSQHPALAVLGTQVRFVDEEGSLLFNSKFPVSHDKLKKKFYINSMLAHPSVVFSLEVVEKEGYYPTNYHAAEDYAYFMKVIKKHEARNLPEIFVIKVIDDKSISAVKRKQQVRNRIRVIWNNFYFGWHPIYGLIRNCILYLFPRKLVSRIKLLKTKL